MYKIIFKKISQRLLNKQSKNTLSLFKKINDNNNKIVFLDIGGAGGLNRRWKEFEKYIKVIFVEPDKRSFQELLNNTVNFKSIYIINISIFSFPL